MILRSARAPLSEAGDARPSHATIRSIWVGCSSSQTTLREGMIRKTVPTDDCFNLGIFWIFDGFSSIPWLLAEDGGVQ